MNETNKKNSIENTYSRADQMEDWISKFVDGNFEITQSEDNKEKN